MLLASQVLKIHFEKLLLREKIKWKPNTQFLTCIYNILKFLRDLKELKKQAKSDGFGFRRTTRKVHIEHLYIKKMLSH